MRNKLQVAIYFPPFRPRVRSISRGFDCQRESDSLDDDVSNVSSDAETESVVTTTQTNTLVLLDEDDHNRRISSQQRNDDGRRNTIDDEQRLARDT
eukprot:scaffold3453_cov23-Cyclotella_meneghiniana.AAC.1